MRLDVYLVASGKFKSRNKAAEAIKKGVVSVDGKVADKPSLGVDENSAVTVNEYDAFVSNGGYKLEKALNDFNLSVENTVCADVGASTGGFTERLLCGGAKKVYAIDVGESQLDESLSKDERVKVIDNFNARELSAQVLGEQVDVVTADVSFISLTLVLKPISDVLKVGGIAVVLVKPQFECGKKYLNKNGIVTDEKARNQAVTNVSRFAESVGLTPVNVTNAPIKQGKNVEYLLMLKKS